MLIDQGLPHVRTRSKQISVALFITIVTKCKEAKYYIVICDDTSNVEQVSQLQIEYCIEGHLFMYMYYVQLPVVHILIHTHVHALTTVSSKFSSSKKFVILAFLLQS